MGSIVFSTNISLVKTGYYDLISSQAKPVSYLSDARGGHYKLPYFNFVQKPFTPIAILLTVDHI